MAVLLVNNSATAEELTVDPWFVEGMNQEETILAPGTTSYCNKDFWVENIGDETAEVHVIRGSGDNYEYDRLGPGAKLLYGLQDRSIFATQASEGHFASDARIINSTMGGQNAKIKVSCK
ncbi:MAG: hypothetical protein ACE5ER_00985 [Nitrospinaceae bacterium]